MEEIILTTPKCTFFYCKGGTIASIEQATVIIVVLSFACLLLALLILGSKALYGAESVLDSYATKFDEIITALSLTTHAHHK